MAVFWIVLAAVLGVAELLTGTFILVMLAAGAIAAAIVAGLDGPAVIQGIVFAAVSGAALFGLRPALQGLVHRNAPSAPMGLQAIEGANGLVLEKIDADHGLIKIDGELWTARPYDETQTFDQGEHVRVIEIRGATALVWKE
ncbi:MAG TPA: NfeD family protein [Micromonosporaceae bacterium]|nr:NfeD family protein [Micromonosporaceae bacterium]HKE64539.1 NfeD family protein [Micromonosporaceae bacterium]